ncbi:hypothetical protein MRX96_024641 [Rhipicephalus microplus]
MRVKGVAGVLATHDSFTQSGHDGARAAYLLLHSVASATHQIYETQHIVMTDEVVRRVCKASVQEITEIWDMFTAEILATVDKENKLRAMFAAVKDAVYHDCVASAVFDDQDSVRIGDFVQRLTLDVTMDAKLSAVALPDVSRDLFAKNLLKGRAYDFDIPEGEANRLRPLSNACVPASTLTSVVGRRNVSAPLVLGLSTVFNAFSRPKWELMRPAWGSLEMSHGQMFYTLAVYYNCPFESTPQEVVQFNEALMYAGDFASVFGCPGRFADGEEASVLSLMACLLPDGL